MPGKTTQKDAKTGYVCNQHKTRQTSRAWRLTSRRHWYPRSGVESSLCKYTPHCGPQMTTANIHIRGGIAHQSEEILGDGADRWVKRNKRCEMKRTLGLCGGGARVFEGASQQFFQADFGNPQCILRLPVPHSCHLRSKAHSRFGCSRNGRCCKRSVKLSMCMHVQFGFDPRTTPKLIPTLTHSV